MRPLRVADREAERDEIILALRATNGKIRRRRGCFEGDLSWCIDMLGRAPALALADTSAQRGFDLLPESVIAQRVIIGKTLADVMNVDFLDLSSKELPIGALPIVLVRPSKRRREGGRYPFFLPGKPDEG